MESTQEEKWFQKYNWSYEKTTDRVLIIQTFIQKSLSISIARIVIDYLRAEGIKGPDFNKNRQQNCCFVVDLVNKEFDLISSWQATIMMRGERTFVAYPSQISQFIATHRGSLVGRKFGL